MSDLAYSEEALSADLRAWWDVEVGGNADPFVDPRPAVTGTIFDVLPAIDSLGCINGLLTIEKHVGFEVPSRLLQSGGYNSFEDMTSDLLPKVRAMVQRRGQATRGKEAA
jgi:hypothetical protein